MSKDYNFDDEIKERFNSIGSKLYTIKYALEEIISIIENEGEINIGTVSILSTINAYFNRAKEDYYKLEEDLGTLM